MGISSFLKRRINKRRAGVLKLENFAKQNEKTASFAREAGDFDAARESLDYADMLRGTNRRRVKKLRRLQAARRLFTRNPRKSKKVR